LLQRSRLESCCECFVVRVICASVSFACQHTSSVDFLGHIPSSHFQDQRQWPCVSIELAPLSCQLCVCVCVRVCSYSLRLCHWLHSSRSLSSSLTSESTPVECSGSTDDLTPSSLRTSVCNYYYRTTTTTTTTTTTVVINPL